MDMEQKNKYIEQYINNIALQINDKYKGLMDEDKISRAINMFKDSSDDLETVIIPRINELAQKVINDFLEFQKQIQELMKINREQQQSELATLDLNTEQNGIYLSQQQIDLLMITDINTKEELKDYIENICGQFPNMKVEDVISNFDSIMSLKQLEEAKRTLYQKYQDGLISYLDNARMSDIQKAKVKLERLGINGQELDYCLTLVSQSRINEAFNYLGQKYGDNFIIKFNRFMNDDFENVKGVSYDEMKSLSELIKRDKSIDTIIVATGKFDNSIYQTTNGKVFDPYLTSKALQFCYSNKKHMRYHALFDQAHVDYLLKQGKGLKDHDQILAEMKAYVKMSMDYIEKNNRQLPDGTMLINTVEVFNERVEKNKADKDSPYSMVWEKYFGITIEEIMSCFDGIKKPDGVEFMYNETTLTESSQKRAMVEKVLYQIEQKQSGFIDVIGDQMHLSDEDVMPKKGLQNLTETAQMLKRFQDGKVVVDGQIKEIKPKKTECTEHDFHFTKAFLENISILNHSGQNTDLWSIKKGMQDIISKTYNQNGVKFEKSTYWSLFGKNDHNIVRANISIQKENFERRKKGLPEKSLIETMSAGLVPDGETFSSIKSLKAEKEQKDLQHKKENKFFDQRSQGEIEIAKQIKQKNQMIKQQKEQTRQMNKPKVRTLSVHSSNSSQNKGFTNVLILSLIASFVAGALFMIIYMIVRW